MSESRALIPIGSRYIGPSILSWMLYYLLPKSRVDKLVKLVEGYGLRKVICCIPRGRQIAATWSKGEVFSRSPVGTLYTGCCTCRTWAGVVALSISTWIYGAVCGGVHLGFTLGTSLTCLPDSRALCTWLLRPLLLLLGRVGQCIDCSLVH